MPGSDELLRSVTIGRWDEINSADAALESAQFERNKTAAHLTQPRIAPKHHLPARTSPYEHLTMKQLVVKVLSEHSQRCNRATDA